MTINLALWESNYYWYAWTPSFPKWGRPQLHQVYLRYQDTPHCNSTLKIDDSALRKEGFTLSDRCPKEIFTGNMATTLSTTDPLFLNFYSGSEGCQFIMGFGQCFGQNWIHSIEHDSDSLWSCYDEMLERAPEYAQFMKKACSGAVSCWVCIMETHLPQSTWVLQTSCIMQKSSRMCRVKLEVLQDPSFSNVSGQ